MRRLLLLLPLALVLPLLGCATFADCQTTSMSRTLQGGVIVGTVSVVCPGHPQSYHGVLYLQRDKIDNRKSTGAWIAHGLITTGSEANVPGDTHPSTFTVTAPCSKGRWRLMWWVHGMMHNGHSASSRGVSDTFLIRSCDAELPEKHLGFHELLPGSS